MATPKENKFRGLLFTLPVPFLGTALWMLLWSWGFLSAIVAWLIAAGTIRLYGRGAGSISRASVPLIIVIIVVSILIAFIGGMGSDLVAAIQKEDKSYTTFDILTSPGYYEVLFQSLIEPQVWKDYGRDFLIAIAFGALGSYFDIRNLLQVTKPKQA